MGITPHQFENKMGLIFKSFIIHIQISKHNFGGVLFHALLSRFSPGGVLFVALVSGFLPVVY